MIDVIIPTLRTQPEVFSLISEIRSTAGTDVRIMATCQSVSASKNRNIGLDWAKSDIIVMVDDDICNFMPGWVRCLADTLNTYKKCVMVSPQLMKPDGTFGFMMGVTRLRSEGISASLGYLPTACIAIRKNDLRFDENFIGSGFEDNDYCAQLRQLVEGARFFVNHNVQVVHKNECKNQHGEYWKHNKEYFERKWKRNQ